MSCRDILAQLRQIQDPSRFLSEAQSLSNQARALRNTTVTASNKDKIINDANQILAQLEQLKQQRLAGQGQLGSLLAAASREKCDDAIRFGEDLRQRYVQAGNEANTAGNITNQAKSTANAFVQETKAAESATKQNNAGTGQPGTAGTGTTATPDAAQLEEVQVTAKKKPETLEEVQVTGVKKDTTGLEEVKVTGKRNPDELEEVQVTGKRNPDELEEVQVTGKRNTNTGVAPQIKKAQAQATLQDATNFGEAKDWRVRLQLSPGANYLYKAADPGIMKPLANSQGVIFPYTPTINVNYAANYQQTSVVHSNYKILQYENSSVDGITISCDFTAQDTEEANYVLAVIHFFRAATKMFYGQDENPKPGTPPPLVFLFGMGQFQFNAHPLVITSFSYNLPADVDYIRAGVTGAASGPNAAATQSPQKSLTLGGIIQNKIQNKISSGIAKIGNRIGLNLTVGGGLGAPSFSPSFNALNPVAVSDPTYVPTKINLSISCMPIISRNNVSNNFSLKDYANGKLLQGVRNPSGGFW